MKTITEHVVNPANDQLKIEVQDDPGHGGASHLYHITGFNSATNPSDPFTTLYGGPAQHSMILFQNGPISADGNGVNGLTHEVLLAIVADRLRGFQSGPYSCKENACALTHIEEAMHWLQSRTLARMRRGIEGTHTV